MQIIVLGMHRSGTSLTTRLINMMGAYVGPEGIYGFTPDNPKGFWERHDVVRCDASLLKLYPPACPGAIITPWMTQWEVPETHARNLPIAMKTILLYMDGHRPWVVKDPYMCLTFEHWKPLLEVPVCVVIYRDPLEIAHSLTVVKNSVPSIEYGIAMWEYYAMSLLNASAGMPRVHVLHSDFLSDPVNTVHQLYHALVAQGVQGLRLPSNREILAFIDPRLYRARADAGYRQQYQLTPHQQALAGMMQGQSQPPGTLTVSERSLKLLGAV